MAPAGSPKALQMAVRCGADAVYLGGPAFNARASAANFTMEQLGEAFDYCHIHNVKAYVTLNTLLKNSELLPAFDAACDMLHMGADAFIVQDLGLIRMLKKHTNAELHASTQMSIHNACGVLAAQKLGCSRVVLARETPLGDIAKIKKETGAEIEIFIHGALCIGFSGQCLMSSMLGGRSGNRGCCAQACRLPYALTGKGKTVDSGYLLSAKDLCCVDYMRDIISCGADSLKIEGRLKRPEYVGVVTRCYRELIDAVQNGDDPDVRDIKRQLSAIFNRGGFTKGYYLRKHDIVFPLQPNNAGCQIGKVISRDGRKIHADIPICRGDGVELRANGISVGGGTVYEIYDANGKTETAVGDVRINSLGNNCAQAEIFRTTDAALIKDITAFTSKERGIIPLEIVLRQTADALELTVSDTAASSSVFREYTFQEGRTGGDDVRAALSKLGGTPYKAGRIILDIKENGYLPQALLNGMRREAIEKLNNCKIERARRRAGIINREKAKKDIALETAEINCVKGFSVGEKSCFAYDTQMLDALLDKAELSRIYFKPYDYNKTAKEVRKNKRIPVFFVPFDIFFSNDEALFKQAASYDGIYAENLGAIELAAKLKKACIAGAGLNVLNSLAAKQLFEVFGCIRVTASPEADGRLLAQICRSEGVEIIAAGRLPLMKLVYCPRRACMGCGKCDGEFGLQGRNGLWLEDKVFKLSECRHIILDGRSLDITDELRNINAAICDLNNTESRVFPVTKGHFELGV